MTSLIFLLTFPLMLLNSVGCLVAIIWLALLGEWSVIGYGLLFIVGMPFLFTLADLPGTLPMWIGLKLQERYWRIPALAFLFLSSLWTSALIVIWCSIHAHKYIHLGAGTNLVPMFLWGYTVATAPLSYMAIRDRQNVFTGLHTILAQLYFLALVVCWTVNGSPTAYGVLAGVALLTFPLLGLALGTADIAFNRKA